MRIEDLKPLPGEPWHELVKRHKALVKGKISRDRLPSFKIRQYFKGDDYREDLARFPGDPEAWVGGPLSLNKLIEKRKRQGWTEGLPLDEIERKLNDPHPVEEALNMDPCEMARECFQEAKAEGFRIEEDDDDGYTPGTISGEG